MRQRLRRPLALLMTVVMVLGLLPTAAFAVEEEAGKTDGIEITSMTLRNFIPFEKDASQAENLSLPADEPPMWDVFEAYALNISVSLESGVQDKTLRLTLPYGMQFVGLNEENGVVTTITGTSIEFVEWEHSAPVYGKEGADYQRDNGTLVVHFKDEGSTVGNFSVNIQPDVAFLRTDQRTEGFLLSGAIQAVVSAGENQSAPLTADIKMCASNSIVTANNGWTSEVTAGAGDTVQTTVNVYWQYLYPSSGSIPYFMDEAVAVFAVPEELTLDTASVTSEGKEITAEPLVNVDEEIKEKYPDCNFYSVTIENFYGAGNALNVRVKIPKTAEEGAVYYIRPVSTEVTAYGQDTSSLFEFPPNNAIDRIRITVRDPDQIYLDVPATTVSLTNFTELGNDTQNFDNYNTTLSYVKITNNSLSEDTGPLIYEVKFAETADLIRTAIRIPSGSTSPEKLTLYYGDNNFVELTQDEISEIAEKVGTVGVQIRFADVHDLPDGATVTGVRAKISGLPKGYISGPGSMAEYSSVTFGRIAPGVENGTKYTDQYRIYSTASDAEEQEWTNCTITISEKPKSVSSIDAPAEMSTLVNGESSTAATHGDTIQISLPLRTVNYITWNGMDTFVIDPVLYVVVPGDLNLSKVSFTDQDGNPIYATQREITPADDSAVMYDGKLYAYQLPNTITGSFDGNMELCSVQATVEYTVPYSAQTASYDRKELLFWGSGRMNVAYNQNWPTHADSYGVNGGKVLGSYHSQVISVTAPEELSISSAMQIEGTDEWFVYDGSDSSLAVFGNDTEANVRVTIRNNTSGPLNSVEVYVPIPKKNINLGTNFGPKDGYHFDMYVDGAEDVPDNWKVEYGVVETAPVDDETAPTSTSGWNTGYTDDTNMVKISMTAAGGLSAGESAEITLKLRATDDPSQNDQKNLFKSWYTYQATSGSGFDASKTMNFGALLQIGELTGTVYADSDRDSTMDTGELGIKDVRVTVTDEGGRVYEDMTNENGQYTISGLPSNQELTVTVYNPYSHENRAGAYRFSAKNLSTTGPIGSDVTSTDNGQTGTITLTSLTGGKGVVNAGLVQPYRVQFMLDKTSDTGYVTPAELYVFPGQKLGDVTDRITVVTPAGQDFLDKWTKSVDNTPVDDDVLLSQVVTADTTYTAQTKTRQSTVNATWWDANAGTMSKKSSWTVQFGQKIPSTGDNAFPADDAVDVRPGYEFKGWEVNGDSENLKQRTEIVDADVYAGVNYVAHYEPKTDISVTLNANSGTFGDDETLILSDLTYGNVVNNATGYAEPTREGHYFAGWAEKEDATSGSQTLMVPTENKTYYAVWVEGEPAEVTVNFDRMGGAWTESGAISFTTPLTGKPGTSLTLPTESDIERTGYTFGGWYTDRGFAEDSKAEAAFPSANQTWYAKWTPKQYTITYDLNGGSVNGSTENIVRSGVDYDSHLQDVPAPTRDGYTLIGWLVSAPDTNPAYGYIIPAANMSTRKVDGNITYTAQWSASAVDVTFHANAVDGSGAAFSDGQTEKTFSNAYSSTMAFADVPVPVRTGYTFKGWVTSADGTGQTQSGSFTFDGQVKDYYAQWEATQVTVTFNPNGGTATDPTSFTLSYGENHPASIPSVTMAGSQLAYWLDMESGAKYAQQADEDEGIQAFPTGPVTENKTYLAIWNNVQYTVTFTNFNQNSGEKKLPAAYGGTPAAPAVTPPEGQVFLHWKVTASQSEGIEVNATYTSDQLLDIQIKGDVTFEAVFAAADVTITYLATPGAWADGETSLSISGKSGTAIGDEAPAAPTREGYDFAGWSKTLTIFPTENTTLTASWTAKTYTITFDKNLDMDNDPGTQEGSVVTVTGTYDETLANVTGTIPDPKEFTPNGYTFVGWQDENGAIYPEITSQIVRGKATYTAYFTSSAGNTVIFHANKDGESGAAFAGGATTKSYQITTAADFSVTDVPLPVWAEHTFVKWVDADGTGAPATLTFANTSGGKDYYAVYEATTYTVTFNYNGGQDSSGFAGPKEITGKALNQTVVEQDVPTVTMEGKNFLGWLNLNNNQTYETAAAVAEVAITADTSYIALWDTQTFDVTYQNYNQSSPSDTIVIPTVYGQQPAAPAVVPNGGYAFDYWAVVSPTGGVEIGDETKTQLSADDLTKLEVTQAITLKAVFKATDYTVTFDDNGGQFAGGSVPTYSVAYNATLSTAEDFAAPTVTKTGSEFRGWTKTGDSTLYTNNTQDSNYIGNAVITSDTVFIASWSGDVRVTFNANGGTISDTDYAEGQAGTAIINAPSPIRYGYTFGGWYTDSDCGESAAESDGSYKFPAANATWYAKWTAKDVTVVFDYGEGKAGNKEQKQITKPFGSTLSGDDIPAPTLAGSTLTGWSREDGTIIPNSNMTSEVISTEGTVTYTAYYTANPITITFDPNYGTFPDGTTKSKSYMKSEGDTMPFADVPVPTKDAQTFVGWKLQETDDSTATTAGNMTFDTDKTYVAVWQDAEYTITFRLGGGSVDGDTTDVVINANHGASFPAVPNVTLSGNSLQGWLNTADGKMYDGSNQAFPETVTESATYIAIWGANTYDVTFTKYDYSDQDTGDNRTLTIPTIYNGVPAAPTVTPPTGRQFTGWKITSGSLQGPNGTLDSNSAAITSAELTRCKVIGAVTLEAQYSDPTYTVTFIPGEDAQLNGKAAYEVTNGKTMADMNFTVPTASKDGATSTSWICSLNGEAMTADEIEKLVINSDVTFTAVWVGDVTVSFVLNGGTITNKVPASVTGAPGTEVTVPLVEQDGYTFEGWYDAETGGNSVTFTDNKTTIGDTSVTYYARWTQNSLTVDPTTQTTTYTGIPVPLTWTVKDQQANSTLTANDYDVTYFNQETGVVTVNKIPTEAGTYTVTFRGKGSYLGKTASATYTIEQANLSSAAVTVTDNSKTYNGSEQYASVNVTLGNTALTMGQDFTVTYDGNCVDAGSYSITVTGIGNYTGEATPTEQLTIVPKALQDGMIQAIPPQYYTGQEITPEITVHDGELVLREGTDFEKLAYSNNSEVGTASVSITGKGNYTGDAKATFSIIAKSTYLEVSVDPASATYGDELSGMTITVTANGTILTEYEDYQLSYQRYNQDGQPEEVSGIDEAGVYIITATGEDNYDGSKGSTVFILYPQDESDGMLVIGQGNIEVEYDGQNHLPTGFTVQWNDGSGTLVDLTDADYELLYSYNNSVPMELVTADTAFINVGIYVVTVKATGNYSGIATFVVTITPKDIAGPDVDVFIDETTYNAGEQTADITVTDGGETLTENVDYTVSDATYTDANEDGYEVLITGMGNYTGSRTELFIIHRAEITVTTNTVSITYGDPLPDISTIIPSVSGIYDADAAGVTVTLAWPTDLSAGTHELTASLSGDRSSNYVVDASGALLVVSTKDMNGADSGVNATLNPDYGYYTGSPLTPHVVVTDSKLGTTLTEGRDYTVSYEDSSGSSLSQLIDLGVYTVVVTGKGNYTGTFELAYTIKDKPSGGGDGGGDHGDHDDDEPAVRYVIRAEAGRGGDISPDGRVRVDRGDDQTFRITADEGYEIADVLVDGESVGAVSRYTFENVRRDHTIEAVFQKSEEVVEPGPADPFDTGVGNWLNTKDHIQYLSGYGDGKFGPTDNMTRAQVAQMFYNLLLNKSVPITVSFTDVAADAWYAQAVNTLASLGIVDGIGDNHYAPERAITRAEFTVIAMRFAHLDTSGENIFSDVTADAWYYDYVVGSIQYGWINGYEDGTFRPNNTITRSEVTAIVNRMLGRSADKVFVDRHADDLTQFSDVPGSYWAYYEIMEAANAHDYVKDNGVEDWTRLQ